MFILTFLGCLAALLLKYRGVSESQGTLIVRSLNPTEGCSAFQILAAPKRNERGSTFALAHRQFFALPAGRAEKINLQLARI